MYFFYIDESGSRDPAISMTKADGTVVPKDHLYVLTAVSLFETKWHPFERNISQLKLELSHNLRHSQGLRFDLAACEVKSVWLRHANLRQAESPFLAALTPEDLTRLQACYYNQLAEHHMRVFSVVIDKRKLHPNLDHHKLHQKTYELLLERIENYLAEYHPKHNGVIVMDDTDKTINRGLALKHAYFQRHGNRNLFFRHILEYPFFTDSKLSNGVQLADLCGYNVYRAFKYQDFEYPFFQNLLPNFYVSHQTADGKLDGLKVFPDNSELIPWANSCYHDYKTRRPTVTGGS